MTLIVPSFDNALVVREATSEELLASQELYDNHFLESSVWQSVRESAHHHE